jgi:hypothetical protein
MAFACLLHVAANLNLLSILPDKVLANSMANNLPIFLAYIMKFS